MMKRFLFAALILFAFSCEEKKEDEKNETSKKASNSSVLPEASGEYGEVVIVMNKEKWDGELGLALKEVFHENVPGLTRAEPFFTTRVIEPFQFNRIFKLAKNLVYVTSFEGSRPADRWLQKTFSEEAQQRIQNEPDLFMRTGDNQYAKGQKVLRLFAKDDASLIAKLKENKTSIRNYFNIAEKQRLAADLRTSTSTRAIAKRLKDKLGFNVKIPVGYELAMLQDDFAWVRFLPSVGPSKNLLVYFKDYESQEEFDYAKIIQLRNEIGKSYVYGDPENEESFMVTEEKYVPIVHRNINFAGNYTVETKGAWKTNNNSVGGPFVSYTFVDQTSNRLYYIEGFIIHPNEEHRELIREMESILTTFRPVKSEAVANAF